MQKAIVKTDAFEVQFCNNLAYFVFQLSSLFTTVFHQ